VKKQRKQTDRDDLRGGATVSEKDDILVLQVDVLVPFGAVDNGSFELACVEGRVRRRGERSNSRDEDVAGPRRRLSTFNVASSDRPDTGRAREAGLLNNGLEDEGGANTELVDDAPVVTADSCDRNAVSVRFWYSRGETRRMGRKVTVAGKGRERTFGSGPLRIELLSRLEGVRV
jgi:hypothetical protein